MAKYIPELELPIPSHLSATVGLGKLLGEMANRGAYDSRPTSPAYQRHHYVQPLAPNEQLTAAYPAVVGSERSYVPAVVRETDQGRILVDPYKFPKAPGVFGRLAGWQVGKTGLQEGHAFEAAEVQRRELSGERLELSTPSVQIRAFPDEPLGKVTDMSAGQQLRHAWRLVNG